MLQKVSMYLLLVMKLTRGGILFTEKCFILTSGTLLVNPIYISSVLI